MMSGAWIVFFLVCLMVVVSSGAFTHHSVRRGPRGSRQHRQTLTPLDVALDREGPSASRNKSSSSKNNNNKQSPKRSKNKFSKSNNNNNKHRGHYKSKTRSNHKNASAKNTKFIQLNKQIIGAETAADVIALLASTPGALTKTSGGGRLNSVNFATSMHRIGRYLAYNRQDRAAALSDPKFALFLCSFAEALAGVDPARSLAEVAKDISTTNGAVVDNPDPKTRIVFSIRERTNLVWALAKLNLVPPQSAVPLRDTQAVMQDLVGTSIQLRTEIINSQMSSTKNKDWIPKLSLLTAKLMDAVSYMMVEATDNEEGGGGGPQQQLANTQEMVNMIWAFALAQRYSAELFEKIGTKLVRALEQSPTTPKPQEFSNGLWAFATADCYTGESQQKLLKLMAHYFETDSSWLAKFKPQELSNTAWALSTLLNDRRETGEANNGTPEQEAEDAMVVTILRKTAQGMIDRCDEYKSQEISNTVWAFGTLGFGIGAEVADKRNLNEFIIVKSDDYEYDAALVDEMLAVMRVSIMPRLRVFKEQELNNVAHGCARIGRIEPEVFQGVAQEFARRRGRVTGQDIGTTLWSFATTRYFEKPAFENMLSRLRMNAVQYWKPQEISNVLWAVGTAGITPQYPEAFDVSLIAPSDRISFETASRDPLTLAFAASAKEILKRPGEFKTQEIKDALWGFSKAGVRHPLVFRTVAEYLVGRERDKVPEGKLHTGSGVDNFSSQELANLLWAYAKQGQLASENSATLNGRMAVYCSMAIDTGETLIKRLVNCVALADLAKYGDLNRCSTNDLSNTIWAMATLGCHHQRFMDAVETQIRERCQRYLSGEERSSLTTLGGQELTNIMWALATLNGLRPELLDVLEEYAEVHCTDDAGNISAQSIAQYFNRQELGNLAWSCTVAEHYPPRLIRLILRGMLGEGEEQSPAYMAEVHNENGLTQHGVMSLLYMSYGIQVDGATNVEMTLPPKFPHGGWCDKQFSGLLGEDESGIALSLTTSKIQSDVSAAFTRVGFDHVEEHIVSMDAVNIKIELLSLDLADPARKIGIEVDGPSHFYHDLDRWSPQNPNEGQVRIRRGKVEYNFDWNADRNKPNGSTSLKDRILRRLGWTVVHVPFWDWYPMKGDAEAEDAYCRNILEQF